MTNESLEYDVLDFSRNPKGKILSVDVDYETSLESDVVEITYGSREGETVQSQAFGSDDISYTVKTQNYDERNKEEVAVPDHVATGSIDNFVDNVLGKFAETDNGDQWEVDELRSL